jgi:hypothetical protein
MIWGESLNFSGLVSASKGYLQYQYKRIYDEILKTGMKETHFASIILRITAHFGK